MVVRKAGSALETRLELLIRAHGLPKPRQQYQFHPTRKYRADFAWPHARLLVEVQGGVWAKGGGRHTRGTGYEADCERMVLAQLAGWRILYVTEKAIGSGQAVAWIKAALGDTLPA